MQLHHLILAQSLTNAKKISVGNIEPHYSVQLI